VTNTAYKNDYTRFVLDAHQIACSKGWHDTKVEPTVERALSLIALIHSEVAEAADAGLYTVERLTPFSIYRTEEVHGVPVPKPHGLFSEYADVLIRLADLYGYMRWESCFTLGEEAQSYMWDEYPPFTFIELGNDRVVQPPAAPDLNTAISIYLTEPLRKGDIAPLVHTPTQLGELKAPTRVRFAFEAMVYGIEELARDACFYLDPDEIDVAPEDLLWRAVSEKMAYNKYRPYRHGGKLA
jgi:hypothetical protein